MLVPVVVADSTSELPLGRLLSVTFRLLRLLALPAPIVAPVALTIGAAVPSVKPPL